MVRKRNVNSRPKRAFNTPRPMPKSKNFSASDIHDNLVKVVHDDRLQKYSNILKGTRIKDVTDAILQHGKPIAAAVDASKWTGLAVYLGSQFLPRAFGPEDSDAGVIDSRGAYDNDSVAGRDVKKYYFHHRISAMQNDLLANAKQRFKPTKIWTYRPSASSWGMMYSNSGLNCKGYVCPSRTTSYTVPVWSYSISPNINDYPFFFQKQDYINAFLSTDQTIPNPTAQSDWKASGATDLYYGIASMHMSVEFMNANRFYPLSLKAYLVRAKTSVGFNPVAAVLGSYNTVQASGAVPAACKKHFQTSTIANQDFTTECSVIPTTYPALSSDFSNYYDIVDVKTFDLNPGDSLDYHLSFQLSKETYMKEIVFTQNAVDANYYGLMFEFQGDPCIAVPRVSGPADADAIYGSAAPSKLRWKCKKWAVMHAGSVMIPGSNTEYMAGGYNFLGQKNERSGLDDALYTASYSSLSNSSGAAGTYYLPVYTDLQEQDGGSVSGQ